MKKIIIAVIVLIIAAAASVTAFLTVKNKNDIEVQQQMEIIDDNVLFQTDSDEITKITIKNSDGNFTAEYIDEVWMLTDSDNGFFPLDDTKISGICNYISQLTASDNYGEATADKKVMYGLDTPFTITFTDTEGEHTLYIGDKSATGDYYYAASEGKDNIYAIPYNDATEILAQKYDLISSKMSSYGDNTIKGMKLIRDGKTVYDLKYDDEEKCWTLPEKYDMLTLDLATVSSMVTILARVTHQGMLSDDPSAFEEYGFDKPYAEFIITGSDGNTESFLFSKEKTQSATYTNVYLEDAGFTETYYTADINFINYEIFDLVEHSVEGASMYKINGFEIDCERGSDSFTIDNDNGVAKCRDTEIDLYNDELLTFFKSFYNSFAYTTISDIDVDVKPELENPVFTVKYKYDSGDIAELCMVESGDDGVCYVFFDGEYTGSLANKNFMDSMIDSYNLLCSHSGIEPVMQ